MKYQALDVGGWTPGPVLPLCPSCGSDDPMRCEWNDAKPHLHAINAGCCPSPFHGCQVAASHNAKLPHPVECSCPTCRRERCLCSECKCKEQGK